MQFTKAGRVTERVTPLCVFGKGDEMKLSELKKVGPKREKDFLKLGVKSEKELAKFYPRAYLDMTSQIGKASCRERV